jgi:hypothetical protein
LCYDWELKKPTGIIKDSAVNVRWDLRAILVAITGKSSRKQTVLDIRQYKQEN